MRSRCLVSMVIVCASLPVTSDEFQVNVRTSSSQANPSVAVAPDGGAVIVWSSYFTTSGRSNDILARRLDPNGACAGDEFQINVGQAGNQTEPDVAIHGAGNIVIAWQGPGLDEEDIFVRVLDGDGQPVTEELLVNSASAGRQIYPTVACSDAGSLVVAWESRTTDPGLAACSIHAQLLDANALPAGPELWIDQGAYDARYPDVAMDAAGNFAVTWMQDRTSKSIFARLFDPNGAPMTGPFEVGTVGFTSITRPSLAMNAAGDFVIAWDGDPNRASDDNIHARCYEPNGAPRGDPFTVSSSSQGAQQWPRVAINNGGDFVIAWQREADDVNTATDILARSFDGDALPMGAELQLNAYTFGKQQYPGVALREDGSFVATWEGEGPNGSGYDIFACITPGPLSADLNADGRVTLADFGVLSRRWRSPIDVGPVDLTHDGIVDTRDLDILCGQWLQGFIVDI